MLANLLECTLFVALELGLIVLVRLSTWVSFSFIFE